MKASELYTLAIEEYKQIIKSYKTVLWKLLQS